MGTTILLKKHPIRLRKAIMKTTFCGSKLLFPVASFFSSSNIKGTPINLNLVG